MESKSYSIASHRIFFFRMFKSNFVPRVRITTARCLCTILTVSLYQPFIGSVIWEKFKIFLDHKKSQAQLPDKQQVGSFSEDCSVFERLPP